MENIRWKKGKKPVCNHLVNFHLIYPNCNSYSVADESSGMKQAVSVREGFKKKSDLSLWVLTPPQKKSDNHFFGN